MIGQTPLPLFSDITEEVEKNRLVIVKLRSAESLARYLGVSWPFFRFNVYRLPQGRRYRSFNIPKKRGGVRNILAPNPELKHLQRLILDRVLAPIYKPKGCVYGFVNDRSISAGAARHVRARHVLNVDLNDFFPSINFGRVYGVLLAKPYCLSKPVAAAIAKACCHFNSLPQGAATSPILSNMVCSRLDSQLLDIAKLNGLTYTRYADDITLSTRRPNFPAAVAEPVPGLPSNVSLLGKLLETAVNDNGFLINPSKTRLKGRDQQQVVTGLIVNKRVNVPRRFIREIRGALHALEIYGDEAQQKYETDYAVGSSKSLKASLLGRIDFVGQIRGRQDAIYLKLLAHAARVDAEYFILPDGADLGAFVDARMWVVETFDLAGSPLGQGSAFSLKDFGLVTCWHVVCPDDEKPAPTITIYRASAPHVKYEATVSKLNKALDLALLTFSDVQRVLSFELRAGLDPRRHELITSCGFPNYSGSGSVNIVPGYVTSEKHIRGHAHYVVSQPLVKGSSGGVVMDKVRKVVGVIATGPVNNAASGLDIDSIIIPVSLVFRV